MKQARKGFIKRLTGGLAAIGIGGKVVASEARPRFDIDKVKKDMREAEKLMNSNKCKSSGNAFCKDMTREEYKKRFADISGSQWSTPDMKRSIERSSKNLTAEIDRELIEFISNNGLRKS